jgi:rhamnose utilization protein RhaD (predicted bifunctional aldolase and dehydrogenase)
MKTKLPTKTKESCIQSAIEKYLQLLENTGRIVYVKNNSGAFMSPRGHFFRFGKAGSPDFFIFVKNGSVIHCEVKNENGKLSALQKEYQARIEKLNHNYFVVRNITDVENILKEYL